MKIHLFKQIEYKPQSITSMASTDSEIYIFRSDKSCEVIDSKTLQQVHFFYTNYLVIRSFLFENYFICSSDLDEILTINIKNYSINTNKIGYKITDLIIYDKKLIITTYNGFVLEVDGDDIQVKYKTTGILNCLFQYGDCFLIGGINKIYILDQNFALINELDLNSPDDHITNIRHVCDEKFGLVTKNGLFIYFDMALLNIIQKVQIRNSSLNCLLIRDGVIYTSGSDSRLISYKLINNIFVKGYQIDLHYGISNCILFDHNRIFVGNSDGILSVLVPCRDNYKYTKIYDRNVQVKSYKDKILINNRKFLELFVVTNNLTPNSNKNSKTKDNCTFKISGDINMSVRNLSYQNKLRVYSDYITDCVLDGNFITYKDSENTKTVELDSLNITTNCDDNSTNCVKNITTNCDDNSTNCVKNITTTNCDNNSTKSVKNITTNCDNNLTNCDIIISEIMSYKLVQENSFDIIKKYKIFYKDALKKEIVTTDLILKLFIFENEIWYATQSYLFNVVRDSKFDLEAVIYDVIVTNKKIIVVKDDWRYIKNYLEPGVFKKKYSTK